MVMVCHFMRMTLIGMNHINNILMSVTMIFNLGLMLRHDLCEPGRIMRLALRVRRQHNPHRQGDGQCKAQE